MGVIRQLADRLHRAMSRVTSSGAFIPEVDGLRFVAIISVIVFHMYGEYFTQKALPPWQEGGDTVAWLIFTGHFGVQLFFVISGFVLALPFAQHHIDGGRPVKLKDYFLRRLTRLEPPYIISLIIYVIVRFYFAGYNVEKIIELMPHFWAHVFYVHGFIYGSISQPGYVSVNHVTWSLEMEVQFYILAPLLANVFRISSPMARRGVLIGAIVMVHHLVTLVPRSSLAVLVVPFLSMFFVGFLLVDVFLVDWKRAPQRTWVWDVIGVLAWCGGPFLLQQGYFADLAAIFVVWIAYMSAFRGVMLSHIFRNRWIVAIGGMCYTLYLYHPIMLWPLQQFWKTYLFGFERTTDLWVIASQQVLYITSVIALCTVLFVAFEKPFMKRRTWRLKLEKPHTH